MSEQKKTYETALTKISNTYFPMIEQQMVGNGLNLDDYQKQCVMSAISSINAVLDAKSITWNDPQLDKSNVTQTLLTIASLKLNSAANPREVYFQMRNIKRGKDDKGKDLWIKQIEMGIEGDGNDAILSNFGRGVKEVHQYWLVRKDDKFVFPRYKGIEMQPPEWEPTGKGEVIRVVYPVTKASGKVEYYIAEREDVTRNLIAHISNNLMNETFGIAENRFKASVDQKKKIDAKKREILAKVQDLGMKALDDEELQGYISPAWKDPQSRESMIIRKMRNNVVKKIPKDFGNAFVELTYEEAEDDSYSRVRREVNEQANQEMLDFETVEPEPKKEQSKPESEPEKIVVMPKGEKVIPMEEGKRQEIIDATFDDVYGEEDEEQTEDGPEPEPTNEGPAF